VAGKVTSIKVDPELWMAAKLLAVRRGITLKAMIESLLRAEIEADSSGGGMMRVSKGHLKSLEERRKRREHPFVILSEKSAVELVREARGGVGVDRLVVGGTCTTAKRRLYVDTSVIVARYKPRDELYNSAENLFNKEESSFPYHHSRW